MQLQIAMNIYVFYDIMMQCLQSLHCLRNVQMFMIEIPYQFVDRWLAAKRFHIFLVIAIRI